jgi:hypothetical protein
VHGDPLDDIGVLQQIERITGVIKAGEREGTFTYRS